MTQKKKFQVINKFFYIKFASQNKKNYVRLINFSYNVIKFINKQFFLMLDNMMKSFYLKLIIFNYFQLKINKKKKLIIEKY